MNKMRNNRTSIILLAACALLTVSLAGSCTSSDGEEKGKAASQHADSTAAPVATFTLEKGRLSTSLSTAGELIAYQQVDLYAKVSSFVKKLYVDVGSEVKEGQLLVTMEAPEITSQLASAQSRVKSQEALYIASKANYDRLIETSKTPGTLAQNDLDHTDAPQQSEMAQWDPMKSAYNEVGEMIKYCGARTPCIGVECHTHVNALADVGPCGNGAHCPM